MNVKQRARFLRFKRVAAFGQEYAADMTPEPPAKKPTKAQALFAGLGTPDDIIDEKQPPSVIGILGRAEVRQLDGAGNFHAGTDNRVAQRRELRRFMKRLREAVIVIGEEQGRPALRRDFAMPGKDNDGALTGAAQKFIDSAQALRAQLVELKFEENFLEKMQAQVLALEAARSGQQSGLQDRTGARSIIDQQILRGQSLVRRLKVLMQNQYADDPDMLAKWKSAVRTEKPARGRAGTARKTAPVAGMPAEVASRGIIPIEPTKAGAAELIDLGNDRSVSLNGAKAV